MDFINWITGNMGEEGEFIYQTQHIVSTIIVLLLAILYFFLGKSKKISDNAKDKILLGTAIFFISFEVLWRIIYVSFQMKPWAEIWPNYPCNLGGILLPIIALTKNKVMKQMFYLFGIVGALLTFAMPDGIFTNTVFVFPILKSILQHTGLILIPVYEYARGTFKPSIKDFPFIFAGCVIHVINAEGINRLLGLDVVAKDYIFFRSGLPFTIPNVPGCITLSVFALLVFALLSYLLGIKESNEFFKKVFAKKTSNTKEPTLQDNQENQK